MVWISTALILVVALQMLFVLGLLRSHAELLTRISQLENQSRDTSPAQPSALTAMPDGVVPMPERVDSTAISAVVGIDPNLQPFNLKLSEASEAYVLLSFLSTTCLTCLDIWRDIIETGTPAGRIEAGEQAAEVLLILKGREEENLGKVRALAADTPVPVVMSGDAWSELSVPGSPYFSLIDARTGSVVGAGSAQSWEQLRSLASDAMLELAVVAGTAADGYRSIIEREDEALRSAGILPGDPSLTAPLVIEEEPEPDTSVGRIETIGSRGVSTS
jgi:hypothetical protein